MVIVAEEAVSRPLVGNGMNFDKFGVRCFETGVIRGQPARGEVEPWWNCWSTALESLAASRIPLRRRNEVKTMKQRTVPAETIKTKDRTEQKKNETAQERR